MEDKLSEVAANKFYSFAYHQFLSEKKLMGSKCKECGYTSIPPKPICSKCQSDKMQLLQMRGKGTLVAYTVISVGAPLLVEEGFDREHPYCSGIVELEEGVKVTARILGADVARPDWIKIGASVTTEYVETIHDEEERVFLAFRLS